MFMIIWTPLSLEVKHVEIEISMLLLQVMQQPHLDVIYGVRERAKISVFTRGELVRVKVTEFGFILVLMVETFYSVMRTSAFFTFWAFFGICEFAELRGVKGVEATFIFKGVGEVTGFVVVWGSTQGAIKTLEGGEVKVPDG
jgi:hypothetical protein